MFVRIFLVKHRSNGGGEGVSVSMLPQKILEFGPTRNLPEAYEEGTPLTLDTLNGTSGVRIEIQL